MYYDLKDFKPDSNERRAMLDSISLELQGTPKVASARRCAL